MDSKLHDFIDRHYTNIIASPCDNSMVYTMLSKRSVGEELNAIGVSFNAFISTSDEFRIWRGERVLQFSVPDVVRDKDDHEITLGYLPDYGIELGHDDDGPMYGEGEQEESDGDDNLQPV